MIIAILVCFVLLLALGASYFTYRVAFYAPETGRDTHSAVSGAQYDPYREVMGLVYHRLGERKYEEVTITSQDGLRLYGRYYHVADGAPLEIGFHGYRSCSTMDFSGGTELSFRLGHNVLLVDQRAHGKSQGKTITFGILERLDCLSWVNYALKRFGPDVKILLYGISMGASTVLMASELALPDNVKGIIADCPYGCPLKIIQKVCADMRIPGKLGTPFLILGARLFGRFDLLQTDAVRAVKHSRVPILILHGEADSFVPCEMSREIQLACPERIQRRTFPGAEHGISYLVDPKGYTQVLRTFIRGVLA